VKSPLLLAIALVACGASRSAPVATIALAPAPTFELRFAIRAYAELPPGTILGWHDATGAALWRCELPAIATNGRIYDGPCASQRVPIPDGGEGRLVVRYGSPAHDRDAREATYPIAVDDELRYLDVGLRFAEITPGIDVWLTDVAIRRMHSAPREDIAVTSAPGFAIGFDIRNDTPTSIVVATFGVEVDEGEGWRRAPLILRCIDEVAPYLATLEPGESRRVPLCDFHTSPGAPLPTSASYRQRVQVGVVTASGTSTDRHQRSEAPVATRLELWEHEEVVRIGLEDEGTTPS
jgi:hypothetical protein